uniref:spectrin beta chain, non-erythrocytic 1-like n=1 Tax=Myxine glutinosa TaxID=7769 RepID=UPI00358FB5B1
MKQLWEHLLGLLATRRARLDANLMFREMTGNDRMDDLKAQVQSQCYGKHLLDVKDLLQKHTLVEADIQLQEERIRIVNDAVQTIAALGDGSKPFDLVQLVQDRVLYLKTRYAELCEMAKLEGSWQRWCFFSVMDELASWICETEALLSSQEVGEDLRSIRRLLARHRTLEGKLCIRRAHMKQVACEGETLTKQGHFYAKEIVERVHEIERMWNRMEELATAQKQRLSDAESLRQFAADSDDLEDWFTDELRLVSCGDVGSDLFSAQTLVKKHKDVMAEISGFRPVMDVLCEQAQNLLTIKTLNKADGPGRFVELERRYSELVETALGREQRLQDALALYKLYSEADLCDLWTDEKEQWLNGMILPACLEDLEVVQHRFQSLDLEVNSVDSHIAVVNQLSLQLINAGHPGEQDIKVKVDHLNDRWNKFLELLDLKKKELQSALSSENFHLEGNATKAWIKEKTKVIESSQDFGKGLAGATTLQLKLAGLERKLATIK